MGFMNWFFRPRLTLPANQPLMGSMAAVAKNDSPQNRRALYDALLQSTFLIPTAKPMGMHDRLRGSRHETEVELLTLRSDAGGVILPVFTSPEALLEWSPRHSSYIAIRASEVIQLTLQHGNAEIVINPRGMPGKSACSKAVELVVEGVHHEAPRRDTSNSGWAPGRCIAYDAQPTGVSAWVTHIPNAYPMIRFKGLSGT